MGHIRQETEIDRSAAALARAGGELPLAYGSVRVDVDRRIGESPVGQRLFTLLLNELLRMKGIVSSIAVTGIEGLAILPGVPLVGADLVAGISAFAESLNAPESPIRTQLLFAASEAFVRVGIGPLASGDVILGADGWRALLGDFARESRWEDSGPYGASLAAAFGAAEVYKRLLIGNAIDDRSRHLLNSFAFSAFDHAVDELAGEGPNVEQLALEDFAVIGCGAGGTAALYVLAMQPGVSGEVGLIEPGIHKLSNLNRYLMTSASDVYEARHKLGSVANHLSRFAPLLRPTLLPVAWEVLDARPWPLVLSTVDTVPARWAIQRRAAPGAVILDGAVLDLLYTVLRVVPGGWCLECKHPFDPEYDVKQRALRWGQTVDTIRAWDVADAAVSVEMVAHLADTQGRRVGDYKDLVDLRFREMPALLECGETRLRADVPSQAPVLPIATTTVGALLAAEVAKHFIAPEAGIRNWLGHDLDRRPDRPRTKWRPALGSCPRHEDRS